jgi:hypothetical protein
LVDRVYKADLPRMRSALEELNARFLNLNPDSVKTNWVKLRIDPFLNHICSLEQLSRSAEFSKEFSHLRKGVRLFHSDLVYLRENIKGLKELLDKQKVGFIQEKRGKRG